MDATFHAFLKQRAGSHANVCKSLGARGIGLMESRLEFLAPANDGECLIYRVEGLVWENRSLILMYSASVADRPILKELERRGVFIMDGARMKAADVSGLREAVERSAFGAPHKLRA